VTFNAGTPGRRGRGEKLENSFRIPGISRRLGASALMGRGERGEKLKKFLYFPVFSRRLGASALMGRGERGEKLKKSFCISRCFPGAAAPRR
jgi:hypothetical protein